MWLTCLTQVWNAISLRHVLERFVVSVHPPKPAGGRGNGNPGAVAEQRLLALFSEEQRGSDSTPLSEPRGISGSFSDRTTRAHAPQNSLDSKVTPLGARSTQDIRFAFTLSVSCGDQHRDGQRPPRDTDIGASPPMRMVGLSPQRGRPCRMALAISRSEIQYEPSSTRPRRNSIRRCRQLGFCASSAAILTPLPVRHPGSRAHRSRPLVPFGS